MKELFINPKYQGKPLTQNINLDIVDLERLKRAEENKAQCDRKRLNKTLASSASESGTPSHSLSH